MRAGACACDSENTSTTLVGPNSIEALHLITSYDVVCPP